MRVGALAALLPLVANTALVARPEPPTYRQLSAGAARIRLLQGRAFWFVIDGAEGDSPNARTVDSVPLGDRGLVKSAIGEWEYSFHHLLDGAVDGAGQKHFGGYPAPPRTRAEAMEVVRRYYNRLRDEALAKATPEQRKCFLSINGHYCYQHYACEWGCDVVGSEVGENINSIQAHIAFTRGAARQYGKPWLMDFSSWYGPSMYDENPKRLWGEYSGPASGHSMSLHVRTYYVSCMSGANVVVAEGGSGNCFVTQQPGPDGMLPLSTLGREAARFYRFVRRHPDRGVPYVPVALVLPVDHGIYPGFGPKVTWHQFPYTAGDQEILDALNVLFPGSLGDPDQPERPDRQPWDPTWKDPDYMRSEALRLVASPHGDLADVLLANAPQSVLDSYPVVILAGDFAPNTVLASRLARYVEGGGTLMLAADGSARRVLAGSLTARLRQPAMGAFTHVRYGRGVVVLLAPVDRGSPTAARPLAKALGQARRDLIPIDVSGHVETLYSRTRDGWVVTVVNNDGVTKTFREAPKVDPKAAQTVKITWRGHGGVRRAVLWGPDADTPLDPARLRIVVPPGEVRIVHLVTQPAGR